VIALIVVTCQVGRPRYPLVRRRLTVVGLAAVAGLVLPLALLTHASSMDQITTLTAALTLAAIFPLTCTFVARTYDLFELDLIMRRALSYGVLVVGMALAGRTLFRALDGGSSPLLFRDAAEIAFGNLLLVLLVPPLHARIAAAIKRSLTRHTYSSRRELARFGDALGGAQTIEGVRRVLSDTLSHTINPLQHHLYLEDKRGYVTALKASVDGAAAPPLPKGIVDEMRRGNIVYRYRWDDGRCKETAPLWAALEADTLVPIFTGGVLHGVLALGAKRSGTCYHAEDLAFLRAAAAQAALGLTNARAFAQLRQMNATLERTIDERTAAERAANVELQTTNGDLARSLDELRHAYSQLEQNHECLLRADRLATLGRLTAGIAHEVNTPLSAVQNALRVLHELGEEYAASIDDPSVEPGDHRDIATEIVTTARSAAEWAEKAARFIRGTKAHARTARDTVSEPFVVSDSVDEVRTLLIHRLRVAGCTLECHEQRPGITVVGDRSAFAQVLINIISNALDAYEDAGKTGVRILVSISESGQTCTIEVRDWAGGIPLQVLPRIFEELFTTKGAGRGTGLGLWISRTIVEKEFGGQLDVMSSLGEGSCFIATLPAVAAARDAHPVPAVPCQNAA
jgi:signal transduction histidine kinase